MTVKCQSATPNLKPNAFFHSFFLIKDRSASTRIHFEFLAHNTVVPCKSDIFSLHQNSFLDRLKEGWKCCWMDESPSRWQVMVGSPISSGKISAIPIPACFLEELSSSNCCCCFWIFPSCPTLSSRDFACLALTVAINCRKTSQRLFELKQVSKFYRHRSMDGRIGVQHF